MHKSTTRVQENTPKQSNNSVEVPYGHSLCLSLMTSQNLAKLKAQNY